MQNADEQKMMVRAQEGEWEGWWWWERIEVRDRGGWWWLVGLRLLSRLVRPGVRVLGT